MARLYILIRKKGFKRYEGVIPAKSGISRDKIKSTLKKSLKSKYSALIVTDDQLKRILVKQKPRRVMRNQKK